ncbi:helix-turn-helix transcriptional regulator [Microbacterium sp. 22242]|uniref:helix-turn-helix transcriptional regulator n=1 Tax=Microbacterium sp. 22242 TaxID=3453896 RepID=UPI003F83DF5E
MPAPTARVLQLLELLQSAELRGARELAERLDVDERTVRRYVRHLVDLDIPVETVRGRYGGYRIAAGFRMPPLILTDAEAVAVVVGLHLAQTAGEPDLAARTATSKILRSLPVESARRLDPLLETAVFGGADAVPAAGVLLTVADAVRSRRRLDVRYRGREGAPSRRTIEPYDVVAHAGHWYLVGRDTALDDERTFRIDRIETARVAAGSFEPPRRDARAHLVRGFAEADLRWRVVLRIRATEERIRAVLPESVAILERLEEGGSVAHRAVIRAERLDWLPAVVVALGVEVIVEGPQELRDLLAEAAERLRAAAESAGYS